MHSLRCTRIAFLAATGLLLATPYAAASCSTFTPSTSYYSTEPSLEPPRDSSGLPQHVIQISDVYTCPKHGGGDHFGGQVPIGVIPQCEACSLTVPRPDAFSVSGFTNLSTSVGDETIAKLFELLPKQSDGTDAPPQHFCSVIDPHAAYTFCMDHGDTLYAVYVPTYKCIDGTLSDCDKEGSIADRTVVQICGVAVDTHAKDSIEGYISSSKPDSVADAPQWAGADQCTPFATSRSHFSVVAAVGLAAAALIVLVMFWYRRTRNVKKAEHATNYGTITEDGYSDE